MSRGPSIVRTGGRAACLLAPLALACAATAGAASAPFAASYRHHTITFTHVDVTSAGTAIGVKDPGLAILLRDAGAVLTWKPGDSSVMLATSAPTVASFSVGDRQYDVGPLTMQARFAPYLRGDEVYVPLDDLLRALDVTLRPEKSGAVLAQVAPGAQPEQPDTNAQPAAQTSAPPATGPATVTGVTVSPDARGYTVAVAVTGSATFAWHRLRSPDNRFWVDIENARLQGPPIDQSEPAPLGSLRVRQIDPATVRIALSLGGPQAVVVASSPSGLVIDVGTETIASLEPAGSGSIGNAVATAEAPAAVTPAPIAEPSNVNPPIPTNPRLIAIDPGHGGSDPGSSHAGTAEKSINLDTALRLRQILIARGWQVQMTRTTDADVFAPNDAPHVELQARDDIANKAGARILVSIHANAFINSGPRGTTTYYSKASDLPLAQMMEQALAADGTKDDGVVKFPYYVTRHSLMPAVLIETAFLSNPGDYALLTSPEWRQKVAQAIADGIDRYAQKYPAPNQPPQ